MIVLVEYVGKPNSGMIEDGVEVARVTQEA